MRKNPLTENNGRDKSFIAQVKSLFYWFKTLSIVKHILFFYFFITIIGSLILFTPLAQNYNSVGYVDSLFVAASSFSDTGLSTVVIAVEFNYFGQAVIAILILVGGVGWFALKAYIFNIFLGRPLSLNSQIALSKERGSTKLGVTSRIITVSVTAMLVVMLIGTIILSIYFYFAGGNFDEPQTWLESQGSVTDHFQNGQWGFYDLQDNFHPNQEFNPQGVWNTSIRDGFFHSIAAINNSGFDILGAHSFAPYYGDYFVQIFLIALFVFGGIGFPVIYDVYEWSRIKAINGNEQFRFSLFTKISCLSYLIITFLGLVATYGIETTVTAGDNTQNISLWKSEQFGSTGNRIMAVFFNTMSTRNAGFATVNYHAFSNTTLLVHSILMFLGSAPSSTGGGVRTTTIAICFLGIWKCITNKSTVRIFNRQVSEPTVLRSFIVLATGSFLILAVTMMLTSSLGTNGGLIPVGNGVEQYSVVDLLFEVSSAFGTTGLSTGLTSLLNTFSKIILIFIMFIGQLGISSTLLVWGSKKTKSRHYHYFTEDVATG